MHFIQKLKCTITVYHSSIVRKAPASCSGQKEADCHDRMSRDLLVQIQDFKKNDSLKSVETRVTTVEGDKVG